MAIAFRVTQDIPASPDRVYRTLTEFTRTTAWLPGVVRVESVTGEAAVCVGSRFRETRRLMGTESTDEFEVLDLREGERISLRVDGDTAISGPASYLFDYSLAPCHLGTRVVVDGEIRVGGVMGLVARLLVPSYRKACARDLQALRAHLASSRRYTPV